MGSFTVRSTLITGLEALEVDTLTFNYRKLYETYQSTDKSMTDFKQRAHSLKTDLYRYEDNTNIKLLSFEAQTHYEIDSNLRDFQVGLAHELTVKQSLENQLRDLKSQVGSLLQQVAETTARLDYLEDFCGTRKLK